MAQLPPNLPKPSSPFLAFLVISSVTLVSPSYQYQEVDHSYESDSVYGEHSSGMSKTDVTLHELGVPKERPKNLTCHVCYSETNGMECMNFSSLSISPASISVDGDDDGETNNEVHRHWTRDSLPGSGFQGFPQQCLNESYVCSVRKFAFSLSNGTGHAPMKTFAIKRNCTLQSKCEPGCVVMGERTRIYVCSTCCTSDFCNTGNGAEAIFRTSFCTLVMIAMFAFNLSIFFSHNQAA